MTHGRQWTPPGGGALWPAHAGTPQAHVPSLSPHGVEGHAPVNKAQHSVHYHMELGKN